MEARDAITAALEDAGIRIATTAGFAAPCVHVEPGDPWSEPVRLGSPARRISRWQLLAIAGQVDSEGSFRELGELVEQVDVALLAARDADGAPIFPSLPAWAKPADYALPGGGDVRYASTIGTIQLTT